MRFLIYIQVIIINHLFIEKIAIFIIKEYDEIKKLG